MMKLTAYLSSSIANEVADAQGNNLFEGARWFAAGLVVACRGKERFPTRACATLSAIYHLPKGVHGAVRRVQNASD